MSRSRHKSSPKEEELESNTLTVRDISRMLDLIMAVADEEQCSYSGAIDRLTERNTPGPATNAGASVIGEFMERTRRIRLKRNELFGAPLFRDPPFDMLLELFATHQRGEEISVTSLCYASGVPATTALRHLNQLEKHGLIVRDGDERDQRRSRVRPTAKALAGVEAIFDRWHAAWSQTLERMEDTA